MKAFCHVSFIVEGAPIVIPTGFARDRDRLLLHGGAASRLMGQLGEGVDVSIAVTLVDGLVLADVAFRHSMNYRSVVLFGRARAITILQRTVPCARSPSTSCPDGGAICRRRRRRSSGDGGRKCRSTRCLPRSGAVRPSRSDAAGADAVDRHRVVRDVHQRIHAGRRSERCRCRSTARWRRGAGII
jgi:hypothetical protein